MCRCVLLAVLAACVRMADDDLVFSIEQALITTPAGADLGRVVTGDWDRVCVFTRHARAMQADSLLGDDWRTLAWSDADTLDTHTLLAFIRGDELVRHTMYTVHKGEFARVGADPWYCLPRERATFQLRQPIEGGNPWIGPV